MVKYEPFLASSIPNLSLDDLLINANTPGGEFNTDCGFRFKTKLVPSEPGKQIRFSDTGVSDENDFEEIIVVIVSSIRRHQVSVSMIQ